MDEANQTEKEQIIVRATGEVDANHKLRELKQLGWRLDKMNGTSDGHLFMLFERDNVRVSAHTEVLPARSGYALEDGLDGLRGNPRRQPAAPQHHKPVLDGT